MTVFFFNCTLGNTKQRRCEKAETLFYLYNPNSARLGWFTQIRYEKIVLIAYAKRNVVVVTVIGIPRAVGGVNIAFLRRRGTNLRTRPKVACQTEL